MFGGNPRLSVSKDVIDAYVHLSNGDFRIYYATPSFIRVNASKKFGEGNSQSNKEKYLAGLFQNEVRGGGITNNTFLL